MSENNLVNNRFAGVGLQLQGARVENNHFAFNFNGVDTPGLTNLVIHNSFTGNTNAAINGLGNPGLPIGPLISAAALATNTNPNANFSY